MTTAAIHLSMPVSPSKVSNAGVPSKNQMKNTEETSPMFAVVLEGRLQSPADPSTAGKVDPEKMLKSLKQLLQTMQEEQKDPQAVEQIKKTIGSLKKVMLALSQNEGEFPSERMEDAERPNQDAKTEDVRYHIQLLEWFEQQIQYIFASPEGEHIKKQQGNLKPLLESFEAGLHQLIQTLAQNGNDPIRGSTIKALREFEHEMSSSGKDSADFIQAGKPGKTPAPKHPSTPGKQEAGQTVGKHTRQTWAASGRNTVSTPTQLSNHTQAVAASVFRKTVASNGKAESTANAGAFPDFQSGPMSRLEQLVLHAREEGKAELEQQFLRDFRKILAKSSLQNSGGRQQLIIKLYPRHLGTLNVQLTQENGEMTATLITSTIAAKNMVDSQLSQLRNAFIHQNLNIDRVQVLITPDQGQANQAHDSHGEQQDHEEQQNENKQHMDEDNEGIETGFSEWLEEAHPI